MTLTKNMIDKLKSDSALRLKVALANGITEQGINMAIKRSSKTLTSFISIETIKKETGLPLNEILETEKATA